MTDDGKPSWRDFAAKALEVAKVASVKGVEIAKTTGQRAAEEIERQRQRRAEADAALREKLTQKVLREQEDRQRKTAEMDFVKAEYGVPHCKFTRTEDGFTVSFNKQNLGIHRGIGHISGQQVGGGLSGLGQAAGLLIGAAGLGVAAAVSAAGKGTMIEVTKDAVIIDGKKMSRRDFGHFSVARTWKGAHREDSLAILGYSFGVQGFEFGGAWTEKEATEVANALNTHLRATPLAGDENRVSPQALRSARPTDF